MISLHAYGGQDYWRDKARHEIDFVLQKSGHPPLAIESKWKASRFDPSGLRFQYGLLLDKMIPLL